MNSFSLATMRLAMRSVARQNIQNVLITLWGDDGKECSFFSLLPSLYAIRQFANGNEDMNLIKESFYKLFNVSYDDFMLLDIPNSTLLDEYQESFLVNYRGNPSKSLLYADPFMGKFDIALSKVGEIPYLDYAKQIEAGGKRAGEFVYLFETLSSLCEVLAVKSDLGIKTRCAYENKDKKALALLIQDYEKLQELLKKFHLKFHALWKRENKTFGWEIQDARLGGLICRLNTCARELEAYLKGEIIQIDELEEQLLPTGGNDTGLDLNHYIGNMSYCIL